MDTKTALLQVLTDLERDMDGIADEMTMRQIKQHEQIAYALALAKEICDEPTL